MKKVDIKDYFLTKDIAVLHTWVSDNYKLFHAIVNSTVRRNNLYSLNKEDLFSEAVIIFYSVVDRYDEEKGQFTTFLYKVVGNELVNKAKALIRSDFQNRVSTIDIDQDIDSGDGRMASLEGLVSVTDESSLMTATLVTMLDEYVENNCDQKVKKIYDLYCEGLSMVDIAKELNVSKQYISQTIMKLADEVRKEWNVNE